MPVYTQLKALMPLEIAKNLLKHIGTFGLPEIIQMDNGPEFINDTVKETVRLVGTSASSILAYSKDVIKKS